MDEENLNLALYKSAKLKSLLKTRDHADCSFIMDDGEKIRAHKLLLACSSPVFEKMFYGPLSSDEVKVTDVDMCDFKQMLEFVYTDNVIINSVHNAWNLYSIANRYLLDDLTTFCVGYIEQNLSMDTLALSYELSDLYGEKSLAEICWNDMIFYTKGVFLYDTEYHIKFSTLCRLLEESIALNDNEILHAIINWAINECGEEGIEVSQNRILDTIDHLNLLKYVNKSQLNISLFKEKSSFENSLIQDCIKNLLHDTKDSCRGIKNKNDLFRVRLTYLCKERQLYKIATELSLEENERIYSMFETNRKIILFGLVINTEREPPNANSPLYNGMNTITVAGNDTADDENVTNAKFVGQMHYDSTLYVPFDRLVVLNANQPYSIAVSYANLDLNSSSIVLHYFSHKMCNQKNKSDFTFFEACGSVIRAFCYYPA